MYALTCRLLLIPNFSFSYRVLLIVQFCLLLYLENCGGKRMPLALYSWTNGSGISVVLWLSLEQWNAPPWPQYLCNGLYLLQPRSWFRFPRLGCYSPSNFWDHSLLEMDTLSSKSNYKYEVQVLPSNGPSQLWRCPLCGFL